MKGPLAILTVETLLVIKSLQQKVPAKVVYGMDSVYSIGCLRFIHSDWSKFQGLLIIGFLCSTNEHKIPIDLKRFQVVSGVVKKVQEKVVQIAETNYHIKSDSCGQFDR